MNRAVYQLMPVGMDRTDARVMPHQGAEVQKIQPFGCPPNGTMGCCYVQIAESGEFIGLVSQASLVKTGKTAPVRDLAAEARDRAGLPRSA